MVRMSVEPSAAVLEWHRPLRAARLASGRSLRNVAAEVKIDPGQLSRIERGTEGVSIEALLRLAIALRLVDLAAAIQPYSSPGRKGSR